MNISVAFRDPEVNSSPPLEQRGPRTTSAEINAEEEIQEAHRESN